MRMRLPLAPATLRAGGRISAGMISVVQMPLPICAAIAPRDWPHFCAPSPESLMISTMCSFSRSGALLLDFLIGFCLVIWFMLFSVDAVERFLNKPHPREIAFLRVDAEQGARATPVRAAVG